MEQSFIPYIGSFLWMSLLLLIGTFLRAKVPILQKLLVPSAMIAGVLGFIFMSQGWIVMPIEGKLVPVPHSTFTMVTTHLFSFGFIGIGLLSSNEGQKGKQVMKGAVWMSLIFLGMIFLQSSIGASVMLAWEAFMEQGLTTGVGLLAGHGFSQGPGQTLAIAEAWEEIGFTDVVSLGLAFSAVGFFGAVLIGVPVANWGLKKGYVTEKDYTLSKDFFVGIVSKQQRTPTGHHITDGSNVDSFSFHLSLMGVVYFLGFGVSYLLAHHILPESMQNIGFGFLYVWGMVVAMLFRKGLNSAGGEHLIDENTIRRLTGMTVDFMIISVMMAVKVSTIKQYLIPFLIITVILYIVTPAIIIFLGRRIGHLGFERTLVMLGYCTGTGASGLLLLRLVDPEFKTTVAMEVGIMNLLCLVAMPIFVFIFMMPKYGLSTVLLMEIGLACLVFIGLFVLTKFKYFGPKQY